MDNGYLIYTWSHKTFPCTIVKSYNAIFAWRVTCKFAHNFSLRLFLQEDGLINRTCCAKVDGFRSYIINFKENPVTELFDSKDLVYLSPDAENTLQNLDPKKVYVIGGLVDDSVKSQVWRWDGWDGWEGLDEKGWMRWDGWEEMDEMGWMRWDGWEGMDGSDAGGGNVMCACLYQKSVCKVTVPKVCTVGLYST